MQKLFYFVIIASILCNGAVHAAGLGSIHVRSGLGQPLNATLPILGTDAQDSDWHCVTAHLESLDGSSVIRAKAELAHTPQSVSIHLTTRQNINEPALNVFVSIGCRFSVRRDFQILIDPVVALPTLAQSPQSESSSTESRRTPVSDVQIAADAVTETILRRDSPTGKHVPAAGSKPDSIATPLPVSKKRSKRHPVSHSVLRLSAPNPIAADDTQPRLQLSDSLASTTEPDPKQLTGLQAMQRRLASILREEDPAQASDTLIRNLQAERETLRAEVTRAQQQNQAEKATFESMREEFRNWNRLLGGFLLICLSAVGWLGWNIHAMRKKQFSTTWHEPWTSNNNAELARLDDTDDTPYVDAAEHSFDSGQHHFLNTGKSGAGAASEAADALGMARLAHPSRDGHAYADASMAIKAEEISDVMELVDVWMALNQTDKVKELLEPFSEVEQPESPLPWLCLLDVYRSLGDRKKYEAICNRITKIYNVKLGPWASGPRIDHPKTLGDFPHVVVNVLSLWESGNVIPYLESLLHDNRDGARCGFDLPVYRDILHLITLAKDPRRQTENGNDINSQAFEILSTPPAEPPEGAEETSPPEPQPTAVKPRIRERPKYITSSYESQILRGSQTSLTAQAPMTVASDSPEQHPADSETSGPGPNDAEPDETPAYNEMSPMAIKLHLAIAYQDIGDKEGAQMLLEEVIEGGTDEQAAQAREMLAALA